MLTLLKFTCSQLDNQSDSDLPNTIVGSSLLWKLVLQLLYQLSNLWFIVQVLMKNSDIHYVNLTVQSTTDLLKKIQQNTKFSTSKNYFTLQIREQSSSQASLCSKKGEKNTHIGSVINKRCISSFSTKFPLLM